MMDVRSYENRDGLQDFDEGMGHVFNSLVFINKRVDASIGDYQLNYLVNNRHVVIVVPRSL